MLLGGGRVLANDRGTDQLMLLQGVLESAGNVHSQAADATLVTLEIVDDVVHPLAVALRVDEPVEVLEQVNDAIQLPLVDSPASLLHVAL